MSYPNSLNSSIQEVVPRYPRSQSTGRQTSSFLLFQQQEEGQEEEEARRQQVPLLLTASAFMVVLHEDKLRMSVAKDANSNDYGDAEKDVAANVKNETAVLGADEENVIIQEEKNAIIQESKLDTIVVAPKKGSDPWILWILGTAGILLLLLIAASAVATPLSTPVSLTRNTSNNVNHDHSSGNVVSSTSTASNNISNSNEEDEESFENCLRSFLFRNTPSTEEALKDTVSPQYQAFEWMTTASQEEERFRVMCQTLQEDPKGLAEAFALATIHFSLNETCPLLTLVTQGCGIGVFHPCSAGGSIECGGDSKIETIEFRDISFENGIGIPPEIYYLSDVLKKLHFRVDAVAGPLPTELGALSKLESLVMSISSPEYQKGTNSPAADNKSVKTELPEEWSGMTALRTLRMKGLGLTGTLPASWGADMKELYWLDLSMNRISGTLPPEWSSMESLWYVLLDSNLLNGTLPPEWSEIESMTRLILSDNSLTGTLPPKWSAMKSLSTLELQDNSLTGTLPPEWSTMKALSTLELHENFLQGSLPPNWSGMEQLQNLKVQNNNLSGTIPGEYSALHLDRLDISGNEEMYGVIPTIFHLYFQIQFAGTNITFLGGSTPTQAVCSFYAFPDEQDCLVGTRYRGTPELCMGGFCMEDAFPSGRLNKLSEAT